MPNNTKNSEWSLSIDLVFQLRVCSWPGPMFVNEVVAAALLVLSIN
jgi:hypothetical protein